MKQASAWIPERYSATLTRSWVVCAHLMSPGAK